MNELTNQEEQILNSSYISKSEAVAGMECNGEDCNHIFEEKELCFDYLIYTEYAWDVDYTLCLKCFRKDIKDETTTGGLLPSNEGNLIADKSKSANLHNTLNNVAD